MHLHNSRSSHPEIHKRNLPHHFIYLFLAVIRAYRVKFGAQRELEMCSERVRDCLREWEDRDGTERGRGIDRGGGGRETEREKRE
eukprot:288434-Amorphochlora_amoeboformis.AAC.1